MTSSTEPNLSPVSEDHVTEVDEIEGSLDGSESVCSDDDIKSFVDDTRDGPPLENDTVLGRVAQDTLEKAENTKTLIEEIQEHLANEPIHGKIRNFHVPPEYAAVFAGATIEREGDRGWFVKSTEWFKKIIDRYASGSYDPSTVDQDIIQLQAQMVYFSSWVNHMDLVATTAESTMKQAHSMALLEGRQWVESKGLNPRVVSSDMLNAIADGATRDRTDFYTTASVTSATIKGFYFALKDFIMYLDRVSQRSQADRMAGRKHA